MCMHTYIHIYIHIHIHTGMQTYIHTYIHTFIPTYKHTYIHACMRAYIHTNIHTYIHVHTYTDKHTYILYSLSSNVSLIACFCAASWCQVKVKYVMSGFIVCHHHISRWSTSLPFRWIILSKCRIFYIISNMLEFTLGKFAYCTNSSFLLTLFYEKLRASR